MDCGAFPGGPRFDIKLSGFSFPGCPRFVVKVLVISFPGCPRFGLKLSFFAFFHARLLTHSLNLPVSELWSFPMSSVILSALSFSRYSRSGVNSWFDPP